MKPVLETFSNAGIFEVISYGLIINLGIYLGSLGLYSLLSYFPNKQHLGDRHPVLRADIVLSLITVLCNTVVFVFGVFLWKHGFIVLNENEPIFWILLEVLFLILVMDLLMYFFHRSVHFLTYFRKIHQRHHEHESTNLLSLFVLHPVESIGFGLMMLGVLLFIPLSATGISIYLVINSLWGTVGHLNHTVLPQPLLRLARKGYLCTSEFHYLHHQYPGCNFGFYTSIWDIIFKTKYTSFEESEKKVQ